MRNEADTRAELIDPQLVQAGWGPVERSFIRRETICPGRILGGGQRATSLCMANSKIQAAIGVRNKPWQWEFHE